MFINSQQVQVISFCTDTAILIVEFLDAEQSDSFCMDTSTLIIEFIVEKLFEYGEQWHLSFSRFTLVKVVDLEVVEEALKELLAYCDGHLLYLLYIN